LSTNSHHFQARGSIARPLLQGRRGVGGDFQPTQALDPGLHGALGDVQKRQLFFGQRRIGRAGIGQDTQNQTRLFRRFGVQKMRLQKREVAVARREIRPFGSGPRRAAAASRSSALATCPAARSASRTAPSGVGGATASSAATRASGPSSLERGDQVIAESLGRGGGLRALIFEPGSPADDDNDHQNGQPRPFAEERKKPVAPDFFVTSSMKLSVFAMPAGSPYLHSNALIARRRQGPQALRGVRGAVA
jgi:hypothetical protein